MDLPLALTMGDPSGIGIEIALMAWMARRERNLPAFYLLADPDVVASRASDLGLDVQLQQVSPNEAMSAFLSSFPIVPLDNVCRNIISGQPSEKSAPAILEAIERAVDHTLDGQSAAVVTNPISKKILYDAGFRHPGHTEYLGVLAADRTGRSVTPVMMIAGPDLRVVPVTIHIPLKDVIDALNCEAIVETGQITAEALRRNFGIVSPRIAVSGVNPHAGEDGALGVEDKSIIEPAVATLRKSGIDASGPYPADTMFHARARAGYDAALCMYHDQALVPAKTLAFDEAVNVTLGLPFIRTSPDHGTAFDIAGKGKARPDSLCAALHMAASMAREHDASDSAPADIP